jgi:hypothetical protein
LRSQARAVVQVRCTDFPEMPRACAVSASEDTALDHAMRSLVELGEPVQGHVERQHLFDFAVAQQEHVVSRIEPDRTVIAATFESGACPRVIDEDAAHGLRCDPEKTFTVGGSELALLQEPQIDLVDERCGRQRVTWRLAAELPPRDLAELVVDERHELFERFTIARAPAREQLRDLPTEHFNVSCGELHRHDNAAREASAQRLRTACHA